MEYKNVYFLGIGGIGMSALARYFLHGGYAVAGYDRTPSHLTGELEAEGAAVHYEDDVRLIPEGFLDPKKTMVVYTPAVPQDHGEYRYFREHGFCVEKRSQMLGHLAEGKYVMAVAGTHGKTTTSTMVAWLNRALTGGGSAFLGGISKNFGGNLVLGDGGRLAVEADEFDRSFLRLYPDVAVVTSADADHLDIYGTHEAVKEAFSQFVRQIRPGGSLIIKRGVDIVIDNPGIAVYRYSYDEPCDFYARNVQLLEGGHYRYDLVTPSGAFEGCTLGVPGWVNIENAVAAVASVWCAAKAGGTPLDADKLRGALASFSGNGVSSSMSTPRSRSIWTTTPIIRASWPQRSPPCGRCSPGGGSRRCSSPTSTPVRATSMRSSPRRCRMPTKWCCCRSIRRARSRFRASPRRSSPDGSPRRAVSSTATIWPTRWPRWTPTL